MKKLTRKSSAARAAATFTAALGAAASIWSLNPTISEAGTSTNTAGPVQQGQSNGGTGDPSLNNPAVTITFAGQTALKNFIISPDITLLQPGTSIILHDGTDGAPVLYSANNDSGTSVQLASKNFTQPDLNPGTPTSPSTADVQIGSAIRTEWHEEGSVDGFYDLINDQIGFNQSTGPISNEALRATSVANPTIINQTTFNTSGNVTSSTGFTLNYSSGSPLSNTYNTALYNQVTGTNIQGGQNRVQFSIGEDPTEALAVAGTASPLLSGSASTGYAVGSAGYGQGNTALQQASLLTSLGTAGARQQFQPVSAADESTDKDDPNTDAPYSTGPWNTAGANNITSTPFAATAVTYSANPGTGLQRIDLGDAQWLQTTGRLQNGALFNVVARTIDTGQRVVFADNTGVDPSWAVGSNDDGNSTTTAAADAQHSIGPSLRFDGKTSGTEAETTIAASRMAVGALSVPEANAASSSAPVRALDVDFTNEVDVNPANDTGGPDGTGDFVRANFDTIVSDGINPIEDGSSYDGTVIPHYAATLISHFNTVKSPNLTALQAYEAANPNTQGLSAAAYNASSWAALSSFDPSEATYNGSNGTSLDQPAFPVTGIKGDSTGDVGAFLSNTVSSDGTAAAGITTASANDPADGLFATGYLIPGLLNYTRQTDGEAVTPVTLSPAALAEQAQVRANYGNLFTTDDGYAANSETIGVSSYYGGGNGLSSNGVAINGAIPITAKTFDGVNASSVSDVSDGTLAPAGNYLFGNFNQNGVRDLSSVEQAVNAALSLYYVDSAGGTQPAKNSMFTSGGGVPNNTVIPSLVGTPGWVTTGTDTKGDLIAMGDFNGDGKFDGADLYLLAIGASLTSANSSTGLNANYLTFSDVVRDPTDVLRKNEALDYINNYLNTTNFSAGALFLRQTGAAVLTETGVTTAVGIPRNATALNTTDPITGLEQFTYDPNGANAFDPADVNRDGVIDFNDAVLVDQYNGQSYENLTQSLAATQQTPVTGAIEPLNLVAVQQVDGESAVGSADLAAINAQLTGVGNTNWYEYTLTKSGPGTITWARTGGTVTVYSGAAFHISSGTVQVDSAIDPFTDSSATGTGTSESLAITVTSGGELEYTDTSTSGILLDRLSNLNIASGGIVSLDTVANHADRTLLLTGALSIAPGSAPSGPLIRPVIGGELDLGNNDLDVQNGSLSAITQLVATAYNGGEWSGSGIISSAAANDTTHLTTLGVISNNGSSGQLYGTGTALGLFDGISPAATDVLVKFTYYGDANLDGVVDASDYSLIDNGYLNGLTGWYNGDFNYDGVVNGSDYTLIDNAFNTQGASLAVEATSPTVQIAAEISAAAGTSSVPEPATSGVIGSAAAIGLLSRRRQRFICDW